MSEMQQLRMPQKREARRFIQSFQTRVMAAGQPGGETGAQAERVISYWIEKLSDLTAEEVQEMSPREALDYQDQINEMIGKLLKKPTKKQ